MSSEHSHSHSHGHSRSMRSRALHALKPHSHDSTAATSELMTSQESSRVGIRAAWIGLAGMAATAGLQVVIAVASGSLALWADTLHNIGHAITTIPLVMAFRFGQRRPTRGYPYGSRRAEDLVGLIIAGVIALSVVLIVVESVRALLRPPELTHLGWVLAAGIVGAAGNELVAVYRIRAGRRIGSAALIAEGHHARVDGLSSVAVVVGVAGVWLGFPRADAIVGLGIGVLVAGILVSSLRVSVRRLMDGVETSVVDDLIVAAECVPGVQGVSEVRARWSGHRIEAELEVSVDRHLGVVEADAVASAVETSLINTVAHLERAVVRLRPTGVGQPA